jgi:GxxExxY protein
MGARFLREFRKLHELPNRIMGELLYKKDVCQLTGFCMEIHRELGKGYDEVIYKDALEIELERAGIQFVREQKFNVSYKNVVLPHSYFADFVVSDKILVEAKACERLSETGDELSGGVWTPVWTVGQLWS